MLLSRRDEVAQSAGERRGRDGLQVVYGRRAGTPLVDGLLFCEKGHVLGAWRNCIRIFCLQWVRRINVQRLGWQRFGVLSGRFN